MLVLPAVLHNTDVQVASLARRNHHIWSLAALAAAHLPRPDLIHRAQDQVAAAINPVLEAWVFINKVFRAFLEGDAFEAP